MSYLTSLLTILKGNFIYLFIYLFVIEQSFFGVITDRSFSSNLLDTCISDIAPSCELEVLFVYLLVTPIRPIF